METKVEPIRGNKLIRNMKQRIESMMNKKAAAVKVSCCCKPEQCLTHIFFTLLQVVSVRIRASTIKTYVL